MQPYNVLVMTATVLKVMAESATSAALAAERQAGDLVDPKECRWVVQHVDTKEIQIAEPGETEDQYDSAGKPI